MTTTNPPTTHNTFAIALDIGTLGSLKAGQTYFPSYSSGTLTLTKSSPNDAMYYKFTATDNSTAFRLFTFMEQPESSSYISLYDENKKLIGENSSPDPVSPPITVSLGNVKKIGDITTAKTY